MGNRKWVSGACFPSGGLAVYTERSSGRLKAADLQTEGDQ